MLFILFVVLFGPLASAGAQPGDEGTPEFEAATKLTKQLGAVRYATREAAAKQLVEMRGTAIPALIAGTSSPDEEVRNRSKSLLPQIKAADWKSRAEAFLADPEGRHKNDPILVAAYENVVGKLDGGSRKLFAEMLRADLDLFVLAVRQPEAVDDVLKERCQRLSEKLDKGHHVPVQGTVGELATLFFLHERGRPARSPWWGGNHPAHQLANPGLAQGMAAKDIGPALRRVVVHWAESRPADDLAAHSYFAANAGKQSIPEAVPLLARVAKDQKVPANFVYEVRFLAIWALGQIGTREAVRALEELLPDRTQIARIPSKGTGTLGDCALAALAQARGKTPGDYGLVTKDAGFALRVTGGGPPIYLDPYWFPDEDSRQAGQKKWKSDAEKSSAKAGK
jgi:PBS lyase HEAT-like repeat